MGPQRQRMQASMIHEGILRKPVDIEMQTAQVAMPPKQNPAPSKAKELQQKALANASATKTAEKLATPVVNPAPTKPASKSGAKSGSSSKKQPNKKLSKKKRASMGVAVLGIVVCMGVGGSVYVYSQIKEITDIMDIGGIYPNISIDGVNMAGLSPEGAIALLETQYDKTNENKSLFFEYYDQIFELPLADIEWVYHLEDVVNEAYNIGKEGTKKENMGKIRELLSESYTFEIPLTYNEEILQEYVANLEEHFYKPAVDSTFTFSNGKFNVIPEQSGTAMNVELTLQNALNTLKTDITAPVEIVVETVPANILSSAYDFDTSLIGSFTTSYSTSQTNRTNLEVGSAFINGTVIQAGDTFSLAAGLKEQTAANGYVNAGVFVGGKLTEGMGGGVCQVSTTFYNAAIRAELEIVQRYGHSSTVGYVPLGMDAAIADGYKDLIVRNDTGYPIYVEAYARGGVLAVNLYGKELHQAGRTISFDTEVTSEIAKPTEKITYDSSMYDDQRVVTYSGNTGKSVAVYKTVKQDGVTVSRELFSRTTYIALADEVTVGTKSRTTASTPTASTTSTSTSTTSNSSSVSSASTTSSSSSTASTPTASTPATPTPTPEPTPAPTPEPTPEPAPLPEPAAAPLPEPAVPEDA